jgi:hypothetical protein
MANNGRPVRLPRAAFQQAFDDVVLLRPLISIICHLRASWRNRRR